MICFLLLLSQYSTTRTKSETQSPNIVFTFREGDAHNVQSDWGNAIQRRKQYKTNLICVHNNCVLVCVARLHFVHWALPQNCVTCFRVYFPFIDLPVLNWMETAGVNTQDKSISVHYFHFSAVMTHNGEVKKPKCASFFGARPIFPQSQLCMARVFKKWFLFYGCGPSTEHVFTKRFTGEKRKLVIPVSYYVFRVEQHKIIIMTLLHGKKCWFYIERYERLFFWSKQTNTVKLLSSICYMLYILHQPGCMLALFWLSLHRARPLWQTRVLYDLWSCPMISRLISTAMF